MNGMESGLGWNQAVCKRSNARAEERDGALYLASSDLNSFLGRGFLTQGKSVILPLSELFHHEFGISFYNGA